MLKEGPSAVILWKGLEGSYRTDGEGIEAGKREDDGKMTKRRRDGDGRNETGKWGIGETDRSVWDGSVLKDPV